jgi:subfamily B ATP-binding cassette protein MsbA
MSPSFWRFLRYVRPYSHICVGSIVCGLIKFTLALVLPGALGLVVRYAVDDRLTNEQQLTRLGIILGAVVLAFALRSPVTYLRTYFAELAGNRAIFDIRRDAYHHLLRLSLRYHTDRRTGDTISRVINDVNTAQGILDRGVLSATIDFIFLIGVAGALFAIDWRLALVSLSTLPVYGASILWVNPRLRRAATDMQDQIAAMSADAAEKLAGLPVVYGFVREKTEEITFFRLQREYLRRVMHWIRVESLQTTSTEFLTAAGPLVVIGYGGYRVIRGDLGLDQFVWFYGFISHLYLPTRRLADASPIVQERLAALDRVFALLDEQPEIADRPDATRLARAIGRIEFRHVHFAYRANLPVLHDIHLTIEPGESVAIVGPSGAGKSTLVSLVPRFYDATLGAILLDGHDLRDLQLRSLREHIGIVTQDPILFSGMIRDNILYGRRGATEAELVEAARMAHVDEFIDDLPEGYETLIGERGVKLSGGQKQRVAIARAFLRDPRILILDEATSNLDSHAENVIQDALEVLMKGRTTLVIAHRLSTVVNCDRVIVIEDGRIVQQGSHASLIRESGPYRKLCEDQFGYVRLEDLASRRAEGTR